MANSEIALDSKAIISSNVDMIPAGLIKDNPLNARSMDDIEGLAKTIEYTGLLQPLTVYSNGDGTYTLLSGHRRIAAIRKIPGTTSATAIPCYIREKPSTVQEEQSMLSAANIGRKDPESLRTEVLRAAQNWNDLCRDDKPQAKKLAEAMKRDFIEEVKHNDAYVNDPDGFINRNFRPKLAYIRLTTGLTAANSTVRTYLKQVEPDQPNPDAAKMEALVSELDSKKDDKPKKTKAITDKDIKKQVQKLADMLAVTQIDDEVRRALCDEMLASCEAYLATFGDEDPTAKR